VGVGSGGVLNFFISYRMWQFFEAMGLKVAYDFGGMQYLFLKGS
jgi:hypothetical protein